MEALTIIQTRTRVQARQQAYPNRNPIMHDRPAMVKYAPRATRIFIPRRRSPGSS